MSKSVKSSTPRKLAVNYIMLSGGETLSKIFAFISFAYLARVMGPDTFGDIEFALAVTMFLNLVVEGGLGLLGTREIAKDEKLILPLTFHIVLMRFVLAFGAFFLLVLFITLSNKSWQEKQLVILYGLTLFGTPGLLQWVFQGLDKMQWVAVSSVIRWSLFAVLVFLFIANPEQVWIVPLIECGAIICVIAFNFTLFRYFFGHFRQSFDAAFCLSLLRQAFPIGLTQVTWGLRAYLPIIILGLLIGGDAVGWFGAAQRIVIALHTFVWMYFFNIYPSLSRCTQQAPDAFRRLLEKSLQITSWASIFIGALGTLLARPLIGFVYGSQYDEAANVFQVLIWLISIILISGHYMYSLFAFNKQWNELFTAVCSAVLCVILTPILILKYGFLGTTYAVVCTEAVTWILNYSFVRNTISVIPFFSHLTKPLIAGGIMTALILVLPPLNFLITAVIAALFYGFGLMILQPGIIQDVRFLIAGNR